MRFGTALLPLTMPLVLAACLGSGGDGGSSLTLDSTPTGTFTSLNDLEAESLVESSAASSVNYRADVVDGDGEIDPDGNVDRGGDLSFEGATLRILTGDEIPPENDGDDPEFEVLGGRLTVNLEGDETLSVDTNTTPAEEGEYALLQRVDEAEVPTDQVYLYDDDDLEYMTFGLWELGIGGPSVDLGGAAWGALTPTAGVNDLAVDEATYVGKLIGHNVIAAGTTVYIADATLSADFVDDEVTFTSLNTRELADETQTASGLNIVGGAGDIDGNTFSGEAINLQAAVDDPALAFDGQFVGAFYGPDAAEAGGWFEVRNSGNNDRFFGSFGAAAVP